MTRERGSESRRRFLGRAAVGTAVALGGCANLVGGDEPSADSEPSATPDEQGDTESSGTATGTASDSDGSGTPETTPSPTNTPEILADVTGTYPSYRYDAGRRAFAAGVTGPTVNPNIAYTLDLPGAVYQPVVRGRTLYLARRRREPGEPTVEAFDLKSGAKQWGADLGSRAGAAPTVTGDHVFVQASGGTYGVDLDGSVAWESESVGTTGFAPTVTEDRVFAVGGQGVAAFDHAGEQAWSVPLGERPFASAAADESRLYLVIPRDQMTTDVLALDAESGRTDWREAVEAEAGFPPVLADDTIYVASDRRDGGVTALSLSDGEPQWSADFALDRGLAAANDTVVAARQERVMARSRSDGSESWSTRLGDEVVAGPVADSETVYVGVEKGDGRGAVHALDTISGQIRWTVSTERPVGTLPAVVDGGLLVATGDGDDSPEKLHVLIDA